VAPARAAANAANSPKNSNTLEFAGRRLRLDLNGSRASDQALEAIRRFVAERSTYFEAPHRRLSARGARWAALGRARYAWRGRCLSLAR